MIGGCSLHSFDPANDMAEVGCMLLRKAWGQGYAREALTEIINYAARELGLKRLRASIDKPNLSSVRLFESLGFKKVDDEIYERVIGY